MKADELRHTVYRRDSKQFIENKIITKQEKGKFLFSVTATYNRHSVPRKDCLYFCLQI